MKIVVLEGSPNKKGSSNLLADEFIRGAEEAGHMVEIIDAADAHLHPCIGCVRCGYEGPCVQKDDMELFRKQILTAAWNADDWTFEDLESHYKTLVRYLNLDDQGMVLGYGCGTVSMTRHSEYPDKAYQFGRGL